MTLVLSPSEIVKKLEIDGRLGLLAKHDSWERRPLGELCSIQNGAPFESSLFNNMGLGMPLIRIRDISKNITETCYSGAFEDAFVVSSGDLLIGMDGDFRLARWMGANGLLNQRVCRLEVTSKLVNKTFVELVVPGYLDAIWKETSATTVKHLSSRSISEIPIPLPPLDEQERIVEILAEQLSRLDAAIASVRAVREKSAKFRRSLLHAAFTGMLIGHDVIPNSLPPGWSMVRLGDCLEKLKSGKFVERGWSPQCLSHPSSDDETWGVLKTTAVQMGDYWAEFNKELPGSLEEKAGLEVNDGDFLMTTTGPRNRCGVICLVKQTRKKLIFSGKILRFRAETSRLMPVWLMYLMMSPDIQKNFDEMKVGTSDSSVSIGNQQVLDLVIPIAPLEEQQKTLEILEAQFSRLDASLAIADVIEEKASAMRRSLLHAAFTGVLTKEWREGAHV